MDTSKEYIKMCEMAEEIQKQRLLYGDYYFNGSDWRICEWGEECMKHNYIWLPRQDQLQDMIKNDFDSSEPITGLNAICQLYINGECTMFDVGTWERIWLQVVMKEKYNKTWNGKEWLK